MEEELDDAELGRVRVAIAFADLAGYTRFTEEEGEEEALSSVERFVEGVTATLPEDARVVKTIGDEVMVVGHDVRALVDWAVGYTSLFEERPEPRIGIPRAELVLPGHLIPRPGRAFDDEHELALQEHRLAIIGEKSSLEPVVNRFAAKRCTKPSLVKF